MLMPHYYAQNYAGIMWTTLTERETGNITQFKMATINRVLALQSSRSFLNKSVRFTQFLMQIDAYEWFQLSYNTFVEFSSDFLRFAAGRARFVMSLCVGEEAL